MGFTDLNDVIRSKILQTMQDKKLRRETMVKRHKLLHLLENAANKKKDIDRQGQHMEETLFSTLFSTQDQLKRVHQTNVIRKNLIKIPDSMTRWSVLVRSADQTTKALKLSGLHQGNMRCLLKESHFAYVLR